jgi:lipid-binding SYLF domain-containing protein
MHPRRLLARTLAFTAVVAAALLLASAPAARAQDSGAKAAALVEQARSSLAKFLSFKEWEALRNILGGAKAIYIAPDVTQVGLLVGGSSGEGVLLRRYGPQWSDPVFMKISSQSVGLQVGAAESNMVMVIMTDVAVDDLLSGVSKVGGQGGFALGSWGAGANASGGASGGFQVLTFTTNSGAFGGSGFGSTEMASIAAYNDAVYGAGATMAKITAGSGKGSGNSAALLDLLKQATAQAWGTSK